mgnify:CR=1 FL=1
MATSEDDGSSSSTDGTDSSTGADSTSTGTDSSGTETGGRDTESSESDSSTGGTTARSEVLQRLLDRGVLPHDVATRLADTASKKA